MNLVCFFERAVPVIPHQNGPEHLTYEEAGCLMTFVCCDCGAVDAAGSDPDLNLCYSCHTLLLEDSEWNDERVEEILDGLRHA